MKKLALLTFGLVIITLTVMSCGNQHLTSFKKGYAAINFTTDSVSYSFVGDTSDSHIQKIPVRIMGDSTAQNRPFKVDIIHDSLTTAQPDDYKILGGLIKAGDFEGNLKIKLLKTEATADTVISLHLRIAKSGNFKVGNEHTTDCVVYWTNKIVVPPWTWYAYFFTSVPSTRTYRIVIQTTGVKSLSLGDITDPSVYGGVVGMKAKGRKFGNYIMEYDKNHPDNHLKNDDGPAAGHDIKPIYFDAKYNNIVLQ